MILSASTRPFSKGAELRAGLAIKRAFLGVESLVGQTLSRATMNYPAAMTYALVANSSGVCTTQSCIDLPCMR